ncbi:serine/threonine-protein kinase gin4 [Pleosporales sp. CAS-2024a]
MDHSYHGHPPTRRRALAETFSRGNEAPQAQRRGDMHSKHQVSSSLPKALPHNESLVANGTLAVRHQQHHHTPENKRLSAVQAHEPRPHNNKRDSDVSNASTNASNNTNRRRKTNIGPWQLGMTIGKGGCSRVRLVRHTHTKQLGAAKIISKATAESVRALSLANLIESAKQDVTTANAIPFGLEREICIMKLLDHPNIVRLYDIWENRNELYLIMEYIEDGELFKYIQEQEGLVEIQAVHIFRQIIAALMYCHRINIHHRDLKPENILLDRQTMTVKLVDFGLAALQPVGKKLTTPCGSPHYAAPEVIKTTSYDGAKADVWSCGVILFVLLCNEPPFNYSGEPRHIGALFRDIMAARYKMPDSLSPEAQDLIRKILVVDPKRRIGLDDIWHHPFMRKYQKELRFEGENATVDHWTGPLPAIADWSTLRRDTIDREIMRYLRTLWHSEKEEVLIQRLLSREPNQEKYFYSALRKYHTDQLENYQPDAHHAVTKSNSDHHHNTRHTPTRQDIQEMPSSNKHQRSQSAYSILNNEHLYSKHSFYESPVSEASYDPYRASRQPIMPNQSNFKQNVTVHRGGGGGGHSNACEGRKRRPVTALGQHPTASSLRVRALRNNSKRSSTMTRHSSERSIPSHRSSSTKRRSLSRASLASSNWANSPPPVVVRSGGLGRRGVSFSHLRDRRSSVMTASSSIDYSAMAYNNSDENASVHRPHTSIGSYGSSDYGSSSHRSSTRQTSSAYRSSRSRAAPRTEMARLRLRTPESPTKFIQTEARKVSTELGKVMEEAFNRSSIGSSIRTSGTGTQDDTPQFDSPPTSFSNTRDSGGSCSIVTPTMKPTIISQRPLPPIPSETPNTFLHRKLAETRAEIARRLNEDGDNLDHFNEVLENLDRLMLPAPNSKRTVSAPAKAPEHPAPLLHAIPEEGHDGHDRFEQHYSPNVRAVTDPVRPQATRAVTEQQQQQQQQQQQTIRLVDQSPTRVAPLNIRKRSGASVNSSRAVTTASPVPWPGPVSNPSVRPFQDVQNDLLRARTTQPAPPPEKKEVIVMKKKKSLWFRRNPEDKDCEQKDNEKQIKDKAAAGMLHIPQAWHGLDDRLKSDVHDTAAGAPPSTAIQPEKSNQSEFPLRTSSATATRSDGALRKGFLGLFGKKPKEDKAKRPIELGADNSSSSSIMSGYDLGTEHSAETANRTGPPEIQMNWLSRFLHIKPASKTLCYDVGRGKVRQDLVRLLRDWQRFGIRNVTFDRETNVINARVDKNNHLKIKPVSFVIELFVVLEHGQRANLCLARFTQTRGAASSFRKVVDIVEDVFRARCMLIENAEKQAAMMEVLD